MTPIGLAAIAFALGLVTAGPTLASVETLQGQAEQLNREGKYRAALELARQSVAEAEATLGPTHRDTAEVVSRLAMMYASLGRYNEALPLLERTVAIAETAGVPESLAIRLQNLAAIYRILGSYDKAIALDIRAVQIMERSYGPNHRITALGLINLSTLYQATGQYDLALPLAQRALTSLKRARPRNDLLIAYGLSNMGGLLRQIGRYGEALPVLQLALDTREKALGSLHSDTATSHNELGKLYRAMGKIEEAIARFRGALRAVATTDIGDQQRQDNGEINRVAIFSANLAEALSKRPHEASLEEAIFYFKLSVNSRQNMRAGTRGMDASIRTSFTKQVADPYRALAALLIQRGRIAEAERVLLLLKESELAEYLRRNGGDRSQTQGLSWTTEEEAYRLALDSIAGRWREFEQRRTAVREGIKLGRLSKSGPELTDLEQRRLQLDTQTVNVIADASRRFVQVSQEANKRRQQALDSARTGLSAKLTELQQRGDGGLRTAGLLLLPAERGLMLIVTTEQGAVPLVRQVSEAELGTLVTSMREAIQQRKDYRKAAQVLYRHLIEPAEAQLGGAKDIQQWAILPFGNLRALPFAALVRPDGTHLIERYAVTILTADGSGKLAGLETPTRETWHGVAFGASQADAEFGNVALPGVRREVCGVIREPEGKDCHPGEGIISGERYLDAAFTPDTLQRMLGPSSGGAQVLHIATHFKVEKSQMLLGDGNKRTAAEILGASPQLGHYDLIALSACDSGVSDGAVESLAGMFRLNGAKAVLATLWPVADVGAEPMMVEFYRQRGERRAMSKGAALREAQRAMIAGRIKDDSGRADLRLPYFWAPYVLMGNWL